SSLVTSPSGDSLERMGVTTFRSVREGGPRVKVHPDSETKAAIRALMFNESDRNSGRPAEAAAAAISARNTHKWLTEASFRWTAGARGCSPLWNVAPHMRRSTNSG